jgi:fumarate reductase flavoprotein subunit
MRKATVAIANLSILVICLVTFASFFFVSFILACAAEPPFLADKHKDAGLTCKSCHQENPPSKLVPTSVCLGCHGGDYAKLAERTQKMAQNPHASHLGNANCESCHHAHKPSENYCAKCHSFGSTLPENGGVTS